MVKPGDTVRYLNAVGGGKVIRVEGKLAYVDDEGFETPVPVNEVVVVLPAGHEPKSRGAALMFDQDAYDSGKSDKRNAPAPKPATLPEPEEEFEIIETEYGDYMTILLGFEAENVKDLEHSGFNCVLVNDSNYFLNYSLLRRADDEGGWTLVKQGEAAPNEIVDIARYTLESVRELERIVFQAVAYKRDKAFDVKSPLNISRKLDLTKFFKVHAFRTGTYFDVPALEVPLYRDAMPRKVFDNKEKKGSK